MDGWWDEGFDPEVGWKIGNGEEYTDPDYQDEVESRQLYNTLESQIIPLFYTRGEDKLPRLWIAKIKNSMKKLGAFFNTHRMIQEYFDKYYFPSFEKRLLLKENNWNRIKELSTWKEKISKEWPNIKILHVETNSTLTVQHVGEKLPVKAEINIGNLTPEDVEVQIYFGPLENDENPQLNSTVVMTTDNNESKNGVYNYFGNILCDKSGRKGYTIRILPKNNLLIHPFELNLIYWAE
ncbi:MAG TPA: hypothetical protein ENI76_00565 [Ignavibacteria bacterium]|nr:hypothetical protein [Ignavibacteria bacterium]